MGSCSETKVKCHHNIDLRFRIVKNGSNYGKKFYGCSLWPISKKKNIVFMEIRASFKCSFCFNVGKFLFFFADFV